MYVLNKSVKRSVNKVLLTTFVAITSFVVLAHDTKVTHPVITLEAIRLLEKQDKVKGEFSELYRITSDKKILKESIYPLFWGAWNAAKNGPWSKTDERIYPDMDAADADEDNGFWHNLVTTPYADLHEINDMTVISGVVREDHPFTKVLNRRKKKKGTSINF